MKAFWGAIPVMLIFNFHGGVCGAETPDLSMEAITQTFADSSLVDPSAPFPRWRNVEEEHRKLLEQELHCEGVKGLGKPKAGDLVKLWEWVQFRCLRISDLNVDFFSQPPFLHPSGASYVSVAWELPQIKAKGSQWLADKWRWVHLLEIKDILDDLPNPPPLLEVIADVNPDQLLQLRRGDSAVDLAHYRLTKKGPTNSLHYKVSKRYLYPWVDSFWFLVAIAVSLTLLLFSSVGLAIKLWKTRQQVRKDRELMIQTLAHELRHPVTSLQLSLEAYRNVFDALPTVGQDEFLRMTTQVQRLFRIVQASGQYLTSSKDGKQTLSLKSVRLESISDFLHDILADYRHKTELRIEGRDSAFRTDPYWLSVCVLNLVKNALIHGAPPVKIWIKIEDSQLVVRVTDHGEHLINKSDLFKAFHKREGSAGMGLGLAIVYRIVSLMNGQISYSENPTSFQFTVKEVLNADAVAS